MRSVCFHGQFAAALDGEIPRVFDVLAPTFSLADQFLQMPSQELQQSSPWIASDGRELLTAGLYSRVYSKKRPELAVDGQAAVRA
jgi:hypothetical protein